MVLVATMECVAMLGAQAAVAAKARQVHMEKRDTEDGVRAGKVPGTSVRVVAISLHGWLIAILRHAVSKLTTTACGAPCAQLGLARKQPTSFAGALATLVNYAHRLKSKKF